MKDVLQRVPPHSIQTITIFSSKYRDSSRSKMGRESYSLGFKTQDSNRGIVSCLDLDCSLAACTLLVNLINVALESQFLGLNIKPIEDPNLLRFGSSVASTYGPFPKGRMGRSIESPSQRGRAMHGAGPARNRTLRYVDSPRLKRHTSCVMQRELSQVEYPVPS